MKPRFRAEWGVVDFGKLFTETNEQKFSLGGVQCKKICSHPGRNLIYSIVKVIYPGVEVSRKEGQKELNNWRAEKIATVLNEVIENAANKYGKW